MKLSSHQKISPRSRSSKMQYVASQNGYWPRPHWVAQFRMKWTCWYRWDDPSYFANQVWSHLAVWVSKSCISTGNVFWMWNLFRRGQSLAGRSTTDSEATGRPRRCCLSWRHRRVTWITWPPLWRSFRLPNSDIFIAPEQYIFHSDGERR